MPQTDDKLIVILSKIQEIGERTARIEVEVANVKDDVKDIKKQDIIQNELLDIHIKGVETANARLDNEIKIRETMQLEQKEMSAKVSELEKPSKFFKSVYAILIYIGAIAGVVYEVGRILKMW